MTDVERIAAAGFDWRRPRTLNDAGSRPWSVCAGGLVVAVRLTPRGGRDAIEGVEQLSDGRSVLKARVRAAATDGEANEALIRLVARVCDVAPRAVRLDAGATARLKRLHIDGDGTVLGAALARVADGGR
jgi:uncharacterized protein YggU (UPF0235/DUF167 family)